MCRRAGISTRLDLHKNFGAAVANIEVVKEPFLKMRWVKGSSDGVMPNLGVVG